MSAAKDIIKGALIGTALAGLFILLVKLIAKVIA